jgi:hypothetical protein
MRAVALLVCLALAAPALAEEAPLSLGLAGLLSKDNRTRLPPITLSAGMPLAEAPWVLRSGGYYEVEIEADGSQELALAGPEFFAAVWVDEAVVEGIEIRPHGISSLEFDEAGTLRLTFVAVRPGRYELAVPGSRGDTQRLQVTIE